MADEIVVIDELRYSTLKKKGPWENRSKSFPWRCTGCLQEFDKRSIGRKHATTCRRPDAKFVRIKKADES